MWTALLVVYVAGFAVTALTVFRNRVLSGGNVMSAAFVVLWPVYWSLFLASFLHNRPSGDRRRPSK